jgi:hypothetical protein
MLLVNRQRRSCLCLELLEDRCVPSTVTNLGDHDPGSLRDAIATTPSGGTVDFQPGLMGTIKLTSGELAINKDLTIQGPGANVITVSGNHVSRVFNIANFTVAISGLTIANGQVMNGFGGGIFNYGTLTVTASTFSGNSADHGGGIENEATLSITTSTFTNNSAHYGGGIENEGTLIVLGSAFSSNGSSVVEVGSAIVNDGTLFVTDSTFSDNASATFGGGIANFGILTITGSTFSGNTG